MSPVTITSSLTDQRLALADALAGDPADMTTAPNLDAIKALPAVVVEPSPALWLDGSSDQGPGRVVRYGVTVHVVVNAQEPIGALIDSEDFVERVLERIPPAWRFDRAEGPVRRSARGGELSVLSAAVQLSMRYSITS